MKLRLTDPMHEAAKKYHHYILWSDEDEAFIGYCPDLSRGGMCHDENPIEAYRKLLEAVNWFIEDELERGRPLPAPTVEPSRPVAA